MGTRTVTPPDPQQRTLFRAIRRQRDNVIDCDIVVDARRHEIDAAGVKFKVAVRVRTREIDYLKFLLDLATDCVGYLLDVHESRDTC